MKSRKGSHELAAGDRAAGVKSGITSLAGFGSGIGSLAGFDWPHRRGARTAIPAARRYALDGERAWTGR